MVGNCPTCGRPIDDALSVPDEAILAALVHPSPNGLPRPWLYVACGRNGRGADWTSWYVTGPPERPGYLPGPLPFEQVKRLAETGALKPEVIDPHDGSVQAYILAPLTCAECGRPRALGSAVRCRRCYESRTSYAKEIEQAVNAAARAVRARGCKLHPRLRDQNR